MSTQSRLQALLSSHTFGRAHIEPPPLPVSVAHSQSGQAMQMGGTTAQSQQQYAGELPHDFDHLVRSVGEW